MVQEKKALHTACPDFKFFCERWLLRDRQRAGELLPVTRAVDVQDFECFVDSLEERFGSLRETCSLALLERFLTLAATGEEPLSTELCDREDDAWNALTGPRFRCTMLAETTCADRCDWDRLVNDTCAFSSSHWDSKQDIFLCDLAPEAP